MKLRISSTILIGICSLANAYPRSDLPSIRFDHKDWELVCDNTRTCRAAGYSAEGDDKRISILLTRRAGPNEPVTVEVQPANFDESGETPKLPEALMMTIDGRVLGTVRLNSETGTGKLSADQVHALLPALLKDATMTWSAAGTTWKLSTAGSTAVLLKMDEFQGRLATPGALARKGNKPEAGVLPSLPKPVIEAAPVSSDDQPVTLAPAQMRKLVSELRAVSADDCGQLAEYGKEGNALALSRLAAGKLLAEYTCAQGAYNTANAFWVINATAPYAPVLVTDFGSEYANGIVTASQRGRGIADCMSYEEWVWDGRTFAQSRSATTGMCRAIARGGTWDLPTLVTDVRRKK